jgi:type IV pilus assembly protein PilO
MTRGLAKIIFFVLLMGITYAADRYLIRPADHQLAEQKARVEAKLSKLKEFEEAAVTFKGLTKQLDELQEAIDFFESKLPPRGEIHTVLEQLTVSAQKHGLHPKTIRTLEQKVGNVSSHETGSSGQPRYIEQPLEMELVGNFNSFYEFLLELEKLPRIMKLRQLKLAKQAGSEGDITATFIVSVFFQDREDIT